MRGKRIYAVNSPVPVIKVDAKICTVSSRRNAWGRLASTPSNVAPGGRG